MVPPLTLKEETKADKLDARRSSGNSKDKPSRITNIDSKTTDPKKRKTGKKRENDPLRGPPSASDLFGSDADSFEEDHRNQRRQHLHRVSWAEQHERYTNTIDSLKSVSVIDLFGTEESSGPKPQQRQRPPDKAILDSSNNEALYSSRREDKESTKARPRQTKTKQQWQQRKQVEFSDDAFYSSRREEKESCKAKILDPTATIELGAFFPREENKKRSKLMVEQEKKRRDNEEGKKANKSTLKRQEKPNPQEGHTEVQHSALSKKDEETAERPLEMSKQKIAMKRLTRESKREAKVMEDLFGSSNNDEDTVPSVTKKSIRSYDIREPAARNSSLTTVTDMFGSDEFEPLRSSEGAQANKRPSRRTIYFSKAMADLYSFASSRDDDRISESEDSSTNGSSWGTRSVKRREKTSKKKEEKPKINVDELFGGNDSVSSSLEFDEQVMNWDDEGAMDALMRDMKKMVSRIDADNHELRKRVRYFDDQNREFKNTLLRDSGCAKELSRVQEHNFLLNAELAKAIQVAREKLDKRDQVMSTVVDKMKALRTEQQQSRELFQMLLQKHQHINSPLEQRCDDCEQRLLRLERDLSRKQHHTNATASKGGGPRFKLSCRNRAVASI